MIVDDELQTRKRFENLLHHFENLKVVASEGIPERAVEIILERKPDIVFIDVEMPRMNGFSLVRTVREKQIYPTFIFVTAYQQYAIKAIKQMAFDYLLKPFDIEELSETLERYERSKSTCENIIDIPLLKCLCEREKEILKYVIKGLTSKEIADMLYISKATVDTYRKSIIKKTDAGTLSDLIIKILAHHK
jgi:two-component system, LytTR family, response regulator LytT